MSKLDVCDRCKTELHQDVYKRGLSAKRPRFYFLMLSKSGAFNGWELGKSRIDLCQNCTAEFLIFAKPKKAKS